MQRDGTTNENSTRSEAVMAIFHCGIRISSENIVLIPVEDENPARRGMKNLPLSQESFNMLYVPPHGVQELILQYRLRPHRNKEMSYLSYLDVGTFLHNDQPGSCGFERDMEFNTIFRRNLEHILCLCLSRMYQIRRAAREFPLRLHLPQDQLQLVICKIPTTLFNWI